MNKKAAFFAGLIISLALPLAAPAHAQLDLFSKEQRIEFTPEWQGDRFPDGRPNVPDSVLARLKDVTADQTWLCSA
jgi:4-hydroxy-4-methyl-2-oxoglutarate aldolase